MDVRTDSLLSRIACRNGNGGRKKGKRVGGKALYPIVMSS